VSESGISDFALEKFQVLKSGQVSQKTKSHAGAFCFGKIQDFELAQLLEMFEAGVANRGLRQVQLPKVWELLEGLQIIVPDVRAGQANPDNRFPGPRQVTPIGAVFDRANLADQTKLTFVRPRAVNTKASRQTHQEQATPCFVAWMHWPPREIGG
jgi:hypothetical protein